jgi:hypothetical protein
MSFPGNMAKYPLVTWLLPSNLEREIKNMSMTCQAVENNPHPACPYII